MRTIQEITNGEDQTSFLMKAYLNPKFWCERVFGLDLADFHEEWLNMISENQRVAIIAPTGFGKTEILGIAYPLWLVWFNTNKEILIISRERDQSTKILERIQKAIEDNELLKQLIPEKKDTWTKTEINLSTGCKIFCKSYNQKETLKSFHVDYLLCDEAASYEDPSIFFRYISTRVMAKKGKLVCISTPVSIIDLMAQLLDNEEYTSGRYPCMKNGNSIWPNRFSNERLAQIKREIGTSSFEREYMCNPRAEEEDALYPPNLVTDCFEYNTKFRRETTGGDVIIGCDFAIASGPRADFDAYIVIEKVGNVSMIIHGERHKGINIKAKVMRLEELYRNYNPKRMIVDESQVGHAVIEELMSMGIPIEGADFHPNSRNSRLVTLRKVIEEKKLSIPRDKEDPLTMTFTDVLIEELIKFKEIRTKAQTKTYQSTGAHDDTVMALSLAVAGAQKFKEYVDMVAVG